MTEKTYYDPETMHHLNMKAVVRETGIKADTLRAWERRYGIPAPERSEGGHRLYSERDIKILLWLKARQEEGLSIKLAVEQWRQLEEAGNDPFSLFQSERTGLPSETHSTLDALREQWVRACQLFDEAAAEQVLANAFAMFPTEDVGIRLLTRGLAEIGDLWEAGDVTVQQEHFASEMARRKLETLIASAPPPVRSGKVLILCPPGEEHTFIPLLITYLLRQSGRAVVFLGANVPKDRLELSIRSLKPVLVIVSATQLTTAASMLDLLQVLCEEKVPSAFGGSVFTRIPALVARIPAHYLGDNLNQVVAKVETLILHHPPVPETALSAEVHEAGKLYKDQLSRIEQEVLDILLSEDWAYSSTAALNRYMSEHISAVLALGAMRPDGQNRDQFLHYFRIGGFQNLNVERYMDTYIDALVKTLGADNLISQSFLPLRE